MSSLKVIIIDDEKLGREVIKKYLSANPDIELLTECSNGFEGIKAINELKPDLIFLDVQMPKITGFEMLELLEEHPKIIFTTAYDQYAIKAFEVNAVDYLLKPFSSERFNEALNKVLSKIKDETKEKKVIEKLASKSATEFLERVVVKDQNKILIINSEDIKYLEAADDYVWIHYEDGKVLKQKTMKYFEDNLNPQDFIRIHRSYIVALREVKKIELLEKETYRVVLTDGEKLSVSANGYQKLREAIK